ncbi:hypothetical protein vseg_012812 [Gypsophila vaccaria]
MGEIIKPFLTRPLQLADQITKAAVEANQLQPECQELQTKTRTLLDLIRHASRVSNDIYERPTRRIIDQTVQVLQKAFALVNKCRTRSILKRAFTVIPNVAFRKVSNQLDNCIGDVTWLLRVYATCNDDDDGGDVEYFGLPPIAQNEPILCLIWEQLARLSSGCLEKRTDAAAQLVSLARDSDHYSRLIIEEGGVRPLLKLAKEGSPEGQEHAARAIGLLGRVTESAEQVVKAGVATVFGKILKDGRMKVQAAVAWAVAELVAQNPKCQDHFGQSNVIRMLISHLASETVQEHSKYNIAIHCHKMSIDSPSSSNTDLDDDKQTVVEVDSDSQVPAFEDASIKAEIKANAARALWQLAKGNVSICSFLSESRALLYLATSLEKGDEELKYNSTMALMEITAMAESNTDLRRSAFKPTSPAAKTILDQLLKNIITVENNDNRLLIPCIRSIGNLSRTFTATQTRVIDPLVNLLDKAVSKATSEALIALLKFVSSDNFLHVTHCNRIIDRNGVKYLVQLVYFGEQLVQIQALILLCYVALHVPQSHALAQEDVVIVLEWATKQGHLMLDPKVLEVLPLAKGRLELYHTRGVRGRRTLSGDTESQ